MGSAHKESSRATPRMTPIDPHSAPGEEASSPSHGLFDPFMDLDQAFHGYESPSGGFVVDDDDVEDDLPLDPEAANVSTSQDTLVGSEGDGTLSGTACTGTSSDLGMSDHQTTDAAATSPSAISTKRAASPEAYSHGPRKSHKKRHKILEGLMVIDVDEEHPGRDPKPVDPIIKSESYVHDLTLDDDIEIEGSGGVVDTDTPGTEDPTAGSGGRMRDCSQAREHPSLTPGFHRSGGQSRASPDGPVAEPRALPSKKLAANRPTRPIPNPALRAKIFERLSRKKTLSGQSNNSGKVVTSDALTKIQAASRAAEPWKNTPHSVQEHDTSNQHEGSKIVKGDNTAQGKSMFEQPETADTADENDLSWMNEEPDALDVDCEIEDLTLQITRLEKAMEKKQKKEKPSLDEEVHLIKLKNKMTLLTNQAAPDKSVTASDPVESPFDAAAEEESRARADADLTEQIQAEVESESDTTLDDDISEFERHLEQQQKGNDSGRDERLAEVLTSVLKDTAPPPAAPKTRKTGPRPKNAREVRAREAEKATKKAAKSKSKQSSGTDQVGQDQDNFNQATSVKKKAPRKRASPKKKHTGNVNPAKPVPAKRKMRWDERDQGTDIILSLLQSDAIRDRMDQGDLQAAPKLSNSRNKTQLLKELVASVPDDINKRVVTSDKGDLLRASRAFGVNKVSATSAGRWLFKGMKTSLLHHQLLATRFMVEREIGDARPHGGINADAMGVGKTLELLATMVANPPARDERRTTLLVVPSSILTQWNDEIIKHVKQAVFPKIQIYKATYDISLKNLESQDIILTSYSEVMNSYPFPTAAQRKGMSAIDLEVWIRTNWEEKRGKLHRMSFYRVALDECHAIKNYRTRTARGCQELQCKLRWVMSGTPIVNGLEELYPYFRFLRLNQGLMDITDFRRFYGNADDPIVMSRVAHMLSFIMIRRTMKDRILGRPIVELPPTHPNLHRLRFGHEEACLYRAIEAKFRQSFNKYLKDGTVERNYQNILVMLLRLRQATAHPFLLQQTIKDVFNLEDLRQLSSELGKNKDSRPVYEQVGRWIHERQSERAEALKASNTQDNGSQSSSAGVAGTSSAFGTSNIGQGSDFSRYLRTLDESEMLARCICNICGDVATVPQITDCSHVFCRDCIQAECEQAAAHGQSQTRCPKCEHQFHGVKPYGDLEASESCGSEATGERDDDDDGVKGKKGKKGRKGKKGDWLNLPGDLLPSAKVIAIKQQILDWEKEAPNDKIIIFTQFRLMTHILVRLCEEEKWKHLSYTGEVPPKARYAIQKDFQDPECKVKVLIAGLKCGGQGLNLTAGNRVISVDLWWNYSVELQAFARVFRIGQEKETYFSRFIIQNTVDERLEKMQIEKTRIIDAALREDNQQFRNLSITELASLFGHLTKDENGDPIIVPEPKDGEEDDEEDSEEEAEVTSGMEDS